MKSALVCAELAEVVGFEPTIQESKSRALTAWLRLNVYISFLITTYARIATPTITIPNIVHDIDDNTIFGSRKIVRRVVWKEIFIYAQCIITSHKI